MLPYRRGAGCRDVVPCSLLEDNGSSDADTGESMCSYECDCGSGGQECVEDGLFYVRVASANVGYLCEVHIFT